MRSDGFTLVEIMVVLFILAIVTAMGAAVARSVIGLQHARLTVARLDLTDKALEGFVQSRYRLPCPADGALDETAAGAGNELRDPATGDCLGNQVRGIVPWRSLGLAETDVTDGYGTRLTYRAAPGLTRDGAMSFRYCDPSGTAGAQTAPTPGMPGTNGIGPRPNQACAQGCSRADASSCTGLAAVLAGRGLEVRDTANVPQTVGAAYVVVSHGENRTRGYAGGSGVLVAAIGPSGPGEAQNAADAPLAAFYVDSPLDATSATYFDDMVRRPGVFAVVTRAGLGPRN